MTRPYGARVLVATAVALLGAHGLVAGCGFELASGPGGSADASATDASVNPRTDAATDAGGTGCGFALDAAAFTASELCAGESSQCAGSATPTDEGLSLTSADSSPSDPQTGAFWRRVALPIGTPFTLTLDVSTHQPPAGGTPGVGYAVALLQADPGADGFPTLTPGEPTAMGINRLEGFRGAAALVKTYDGSADYGVFALATRPIPFDELGNVPRANDERFLRTDPTYQRLVIQGDATGYSVELFRFAGPDFVDGHSLEKATFTVPDGAKALTRIDFVGVAGARGNDQYSQSAHVLRALSLACEP